MYDFEIEKQDMGEGCGIAVQLTLLRHYNVHRSLDGEGPSVYNVYTEVSLGLRVQCILVYC